MTWTNNIFLIVIERWWTRRQAYIFLTEEIDIPHTVGLENPHTRRNARHMYIRQTVPKIIVTLILLMWRIW